MSSTVTEPAVDAVGDRRRRNLVLLIIASCQLMIVLDGTVVYIALPKIQDDLGMSPTGLAWIVNTYTLAFGGLLLLGGRAGDILGQRRVFVAGIALFGLASLGGGLAPDDWALLLARTVQGVGAALAAPSALALIPANFAEGPERNRAVGVYTAVAAAGGAIGFILGGVLSDYASWRWVLFINVPVAVAVLLLAPSIAETTRRSGQLDLPGALTSTGAMLSLVYGLIRASSEGWDDPAVLGVLIGAVVLLGAFVVIERRARQPIVPLNLLADRGRAGAFATMLVFPAAMFGMFFFLSQFLQLNHGYSALRTGFAFLPLTAVILAASAVAVKVLPKAGAKVLSSVGAALATVGFVWLTRLSTDTAYLTGVLGPLLLLGTGAGLLFPALTAAIMSGVAGAESGAAASLLNAMQQVGGALGVAVLVSVAGTASGQVDGMTRGIAAGIAFTAMAVVLPLLGRRARAAAGPA